MANPVLTPGGETKVFDYNADEWDGVRTPNVFKTVELTALGRTAVWDPPVGKRVRVMGIAICYGGATIAALGRIVLTLYDGATPIIKAATSLSNTATIQPPFIVNFPGNGYLATLDQTLEIDMSSVLASNQIFVNLWGTEE